MNPVRPDSATASIYRPVTIIAHQAFEDIGAHGAPTVARVVAAFGLGLVSGAYLGRALPPLILAASVYGLRLRCHASRSWRHDVDVILLKMAVPGWLATSITTFTTRRDTLDVSVNLHSAPQHTTSVLR